MYIEQAIEVLKTEADSILGLTERIDDNFIKMIDLISNSTGRVILSGIGKSGLIGQKISATLNSTGTNSFILHPVEARHGDLGMVSKEDIFIALSNSGETEELNILLPNIQTIGCPIIAFTGNKNSTLAKHSNLVIDVGVEKEACPLGLAPTSSTTALLAMGDALAVVLINRKRFKSSDFRKYHPGGRLGQRLSFKVADIMIKTEGVPLVLNDTDLKSGIEILDSKKLGAVIVVDDKNTLKGIITDGDIRHCLTKGADFSNLKVSDIMTANPRSVSGSAPLYDALNTMEEFQITVLPVVSDDNIVTGILHLHDILGKGEFKFDGI